MGKSRSASILLLYLCQWFSSCHTGCPYKECYCAGRIISCSGISLQAIPQLVSTNSSIHWSLAIDGNNISKVPDRSLPPNLTDIGFDDNPILSIDNDAFTDSVYTLTSLMFANVAFTRIPDAFGRLRALTYLSITGANITDWNDDVWTNIGQTLQTLYLEIVGMTTWPNWIQGFTNLTDLSISFNSFSSIPDGALDRVASSLTTLSLNNNKLTMIPKALSKLNSLQMLYLQNNYIADVRWLPQNSQLDMLSLSYNYIWNASQLTQVLRPYSTLLNSLDLDNNRLTSIPDISYLVNVRALEFTHNRISDSVSGSVASNVFMLDLSYNLFPFVPRIVPQLPLMSNVPLSYNAIKMIQETDFHNDTTSIDLSYNLLTELTDTSFPDNFGLQFLYLNNNPLTTISVVALQRLPSLNYLGLQQTKLTRLPVGLSYLNSLVNLDVSNSAMLVCTCMESSLTTWITNHNPENVLGNCGQTSVYIFFSVLAPSCPVTRPVTQ